MSTNAELLARREAAVARGVATAAPIFVDHAENAELWDVEGRRYIDFAGGIGVLNFGHRHPRIVDAVQKQLERFTHTAFQVAAYEPYIALAERLNELAPGDQPKKSFIVSTGAEAVENAVKIARRYTGRPGVVAFTGAFHGRTLFTTALTGKVVPYKAGFGPFPGDVYRIPFPMTQNTDAVRQSLSALKWIFKTDVEPSRVAAIVIEPVQGEGGFYVAPFELLHELRNLCDEHGIVLIADEIQSGMARTGTYFAIEHSGVIPDLITTAKSLAGGLPLAAVVGRADIMDAPDPGGLGGTYGGNPLGCAAALAVLDIIKEEDMLERSKQVGLQLTERIYTFRTRSNLSPIGDIRALGAMVAFDIVKDRETHEPDSDATKALTTTALDKGLVLLSCGIHGNTIRILVPLTAPEAVIDEGLDIIEACLAQ